MVDFGTEGESAPGVGDGWAAAVQYRVRAPTIERVVRSNIPHVPSTRSCGDASSIETLMLKGAATEKIDPLISRIPANRRSMLHPRAQRSNEVEQVPGRQSDDIGLPGRVATSRRSSAAERSSARRNYAQMASGRPAKGAEYVW